MEKFDFLPLLRLALVLFMGIVAVACSRDSGESGKGFSVEWDPEKSVHPDEEGAAVLLIHASHGTRWSAEITAGDTWVSFSRATSGGVTFSQGEVSDALSSRRLYLYYWPNPTREERHATVRFTFEGREPTEMTLTQFSTSAAEDLYDTEQHLAWAEIPARRAGATYQYITHFAPLRNQAAGTTFEARNYTMCYDRTKLGAWWVAYPLHAAYIGSGRTETWAYDPRVAAHDQADLARSYPSPDYDRGHQIPNADRNASATMQAQTFYFTNMTPQTAQLNQQPWAALERMAREKWICSDTLYVVTGAWWGGEFRTTPDRTGRACPVPTAYFKLFARTVRGDIRRIGDRLGDYAASELKTIAFWVENAADQGTPREWVRSVTQIEALTGFNFFPTLPEEVKRERDATSWGL